jgi:hypothetical protein
MTTERFVFPRIKQKYPDIRFDDNWGEGRRCLEEVLERYYRGVLVLTSGPRCAMV